MDKIDSCARFVRSAQTRSYGAIRLSDVMAQFESAVGGTTLALERLEGMSLLVNHMDEILTATAP